jgi:hypothetical protein
MKPDGGMAFPGFEYVPGHGANIPVDLPNGGKDWAVYSNGMTLRDYFAAKAMHAELNTAGMLVGPAEALAEAAEKAGRSIEQQIAFNSYELADAMLAERAKP